jgi:hypothetical protein
MLEFNLVSERTNLLPASFGGKVEFQPSRFYQGSERKFEGKLAIFQIFSFFRSLAAKKHWPH